MFCHNCGKEVGEGAAFCSHCGAKQDAAKNAGAGKEITNTPKSDQAGTIPSGNILSENSLSGNIPPVDIQVPGNSGKPEKKKKGKGGIIALVIAVVLILAAGIGGALYFTGDAYISRKNMKQAEECFEAEEYEDALAYYREALKRNPGLADAYIRSADIYVLEEEYGEAIEILEKGLKKTRDDEESQEIIEEKVEEVKRAENAAAGKKLQEYLEKELVPQYGYADLSAKTRTLGWDVSWEENENWTSALGIANAEIFDWDGDEKDEMLVITLEEQNIRLSIFEVEENVPVKKAEYMEERCSDMIGYDVIYSVVNGGGVNYLFFKEEMSGILSDGYNANVKLYRYDGTNLYMPLAVLQTSGGSSDFAYTAYEYDGSGNLLSEETVFDEVWDHEINYDSVHCYERVADLFGKYGLILNSAAAINGEKELFYDLEASAGYKELLVLSMWGIYQYDGSVVYHFNDWDSPILVYESFLRGEKTVRARTGAWFSDQEQMDLTFQDLLTKVENEYLTYNDRNTVSRVEYAYLDCGGDGVEELAVRFVGLGIYDPDDDSDIMVVISCKEGELELVYSRESWARSNTTINYNGCIYTGGSGGAGDYYEELEYINAEGTVQTVCTTETLYGWWISYVSGEAYGEAFGRTGDPTMQIIIYDVNGATYHVAYFDEYLKGQCWDYVARCEAEGKVFVQEEEIEDILMQRVDELGIKEEWLDDNNLYWRWLWY